MQPFISLIMPVYNNEKYFPRAVESVLSQSFSDWELIIVDDGSTDDTPHIADRLAKNDNRIRVIHQDNQWIYASVNNGTAVANGKYVLMFNSDDLLNKEALKKIYEVAIIDDADIVMFNLSENLCDDEQNIVCRDIGGRSRFLSSDFSCKGKNEIHDKWIDFLKQELVSHQCVYKTSIAKSIQMKNDTYAGDYLYNIQLADQINVAAGTAYEVYVFLDYQKNNMNTSIGKYYGYEHKMFNDMYEGYKNLFEKWGVYGDEAKHYLSHARISGLTHECRGIISQTGSVDDKLKAILDSASDEVVYKFAIDGECMEELESRILSACRELFVVDKPSSDCSYFFMYELLESLLRYEKTPEDMAKIKAGVYHPLNFKNIGRSFMDKLASEVSDGTLWEAQTAR